MIYGSVCSGIEAASAAWHPLGWHAAFFSEIDKFPSALLRKRWPGVPNFGDMTKFKRWPDAALDVLIGGTPCQSFSTAGLRGGLADPRGNLMLVYLALADKYRPTWLVWENVPGVLSSNDGRDFGAFLGGLVELGYGFAYRILDAQYYGLAQRRKRVFVVGHSRDWRAAASVLFEPQSLRWDIRPSRGARAAAAAGRRNGAEHRGAAEPEIAVALTTGSSVGVDGAKGGHLIVEPVAFDASRLTTPKENFIPKQGDPSFALSAAGHVPVLAFDTTQITHAENRCRPEPGDACHPLAAGAHVPTIAFDIYNQSASDDLGKTLQAGGRDGIPHVLDGGSIAPWLVSPKQGAKEVDISQALNTGCGNTVGCNQGGELLISPSGLRRLTPRECERLQGFPDDYTLIEHRGAPARDGPRYKALGNSMAVPVIRWLGERIEAVHRDLEERER